MADINVSLGLDDSKYKQGLARAEQQAKSFGNTVNQQFGSGNQAFTRMAAGVDALNVKFQNLGRVIVGVGLASFVASALRSADSLSDLSSALGVTTSRLMEMETAANGAGGNLESLSGMIGRMEGNLQGAIEGNKKMREALDQVGIGVADIESKTPDQLFNSIAVALAKMDNPLQRAAIGAELFGKAARTFDFRGYVAGLTSVYGTMDQQGRAVEEAAKMMDEFAMTMRLVSAEFLKLVGPVISLVTPLNENSTAMEKASFAAKVLAGALGLFAAGSIINAIKAVSGAVTYLTGILLGSAGATTAETTAMAANTAGLAANARARAAGAAARVASLEASLAAARAEIASAQGLVATAGASKAAERATWLLVSARAALADATAVAATAERGLTVAVGANTAANTANAASGAGLLAWLGKYKTALTAAAVAVGALLYSKDAGAASEDQTINLNRQLGKLSKEGQDAFFKLRGEARKYAEEQLIAKDIAEQQEAIMKRIGAVKDTTPSMTGGSNKPGGWALSDEENKKIDESFKRQNEALAQLKAGFQEKTAEQLKGLEYAKQSVTMSEREKAITSESNELKQRYTQAIADLEQRRASLVADLSSKEASTRASAQRELPLVEQAIRQVTEAYQQQLPAIEAAAAAAVEAAQKQRAAEQLKQFAAAETARQQDELKRIQDDMAKMTLPELERRYYDIAAAARDSADVAIRAENERRRLAGQTAMSLEEEAQYRKEASKNTNQLMMATKRHYDMSRSWSTGWKRAMNDYVENAGNAAQRAENLFRTATQGMEEALVNFAKTGKFEWRGFLQMMLEELLRSQIQQVFAQIMGSMRDSMNGVTSQAGGGGGGGSLLGSLVSGIGNLFGGGGSSGGTRGSTGSSGGGNILNSIGNAIGGLFGSNPKTNPMVIGGGIGGGGWGSTVGNVLGNITGGIGSVVSGIGSGISSVVKGIGDFFGGFFANGGTLGAGKWGIAGERGPELITGPANIYPLNGMGGGVTNVTYNIQAVDAASFKQLVARDPGFIHAVAQQGAKGTGVTRR